MNAEEVKHELESAPVEVADKKKPTKKEPVSPSVRRDPEYKWEAERIRDRKPVRGIFRFHEVQGGTLSFSYLKYKGDPVDKFELKDGEVYTLPLGVARHLRTSGWYPVHHYAMDPNGNPLKSVGKKVKRYTFEPLDFIADETFHQSDNDKSIMTVTQL